MLEEHASWFRGSVAFEFRNEATYFDDEVRNALRRHSFPLVMHPNSLGRSTVGTSASGRGVRDLLEYKPEPMSRVATLGALTSSSMVYLRLHGHNDEHSGEYSMEELEEVAKHIHA